MIVSGLTPVEKANSHDTSVTAATDILSATIAPSSGRDSNIFHIMVAFSAVGVFSARVTKSDTTVSINFNSGSDLTANAAYMFDMLVHTGDAVQFRYSATATMLVLRVQEIGVAT